MKAKVHKENEDQIKAKFPITGHVAGWFFRVEETSNNVYRVEGTDLFGRTVYREGNDPDSMLENCIKDSEKIQSQPK